MARKYEEIVESVFKALVDLGGYGSNNEILEWVINRRPGSEVDALHNDVAWAKSDLKKYGAISNATRGTWAITKEFKNQREVDAKKILAHNRAARRSNKEKEKAGRADISEELKPWREKLAKILLEMDWYAFECLTQQLLKKCGFSPVKLTTKTSKTTGDGGIDGTGKLRINGIFSFNVAFQCKRYSGSVSVKEIRDFRGALTADIEKGIFITTGTFTEPAKKEASIAGKQQIDLIDGKELIDLLQKNNIGVRNETITISEVDEEFFKELSNKE